MKFGDKIYTFDKYDNIIEVIFVRAIDDVDSSVIYPSGNSSVVSTSQLNKDFRRLIDSKVDKLIAEYCEEVNVRKQRHEARVKRFLERKAQLEHDEETKDEIV